MSTRRRTAVDLFAGTGGATRAFREAGWLVVSIDITAQRGGADVVADVRALPLARGTAIDFLWASPPCTEFSRADPRVDHATKRPSIELVAATLEAVAELRPRFWILENVTGAIPFLGIPVQKLGPWCLWGYFPHIYAPFSVQTHRKSRFHSAAVKAAIPWELSRAVHRSVERHLGVAHLLDLRPFRRHRRLGNRPPSGLQLDALRPSE